jgi:hypothetical protein
MSYSITVSKWYDTITPESRDSGDYESTGNGCRAWTYDTLVDAARAYAEQLQSIGYYDRPGLDSNGNFNYCGEVIYALDPDVDYSTGSEDYDRVGVVGLDWGNQSRQSLLFNKLVQRYLNRG